MAIKAIDHIHNNRHVGFDIIMQISRVVCQRANIKMKLKDLVIKCFSS